MFYTKALQDFLDQDQNDWQDLPCFQGDIQKIMHKLDKEVCQGLCITPKPHDVFRAFMLTKRSQIRAVVLGQDPYPTSGDAHGLAFSTPQGRLIPRSLQTIFKAYCADLGHALPCSGDLSPWAYAGVLLLNRSLTTIEGQSDAHKNYGWQTLLLQVIEALNKNTSPIIFFLWGKKAQESVETLIAPHHITLKAPHPSPLGRGKTPRGAPHPFMTHQPFKKSTEILREKGLPPIDWRL